MIEKTVDAMLKLHKKRRASSKPEDQAYMAHWDQCDECNLLSLCPEGVKLDKACWASK